MQTLHTLNDLRIRDGVRGREKVAHVRRIPRARSDTVDMQPLCLRRLGRGEDGEEEQIVQLGHGAACGRMPCIGMLSTLVAEAGEVRFLLCRAAFLLQCRTDALKCRICFLHLSAQVCDNIFEQGNLLAHCRCAHFFFLMQSAVSVRHRDRLASL